MPISEEMGEEGEEEGEEEEEEEEGGSGVEEAEKELEGLSVRQLKDYLVGRGVDTSDCIEKMDLVRAVKKAVGGGEEEREGEEDPCVLLRGEVDERLLEPVFEKLGGVNEPFMNVLRCHPGEFYFISLHFIFHYFILFYFQKIFLFSDFSSTFSFSHFSSERF